MKSSIREFALVMALSIPAVCNAEYMLTNDAIGASSFNAAGNWSPHAAPASGNYYCTAGYTLRTPTDGGFYPFAGDSLWVGGGSGGAAFSPSTGNANAFLFKGNGISIVVDNLILDGSQIRDGLTDGNSTALYGNIYVTDNGGAFMAQDTNFINSDISGSGPIYIGDNGSGNADRVIVFTSPSSTFDGSIMLTNIHSSVNFSRLAFASGSVMNFTIGANGVNNRVFGQGTLVLNGTFVFNLTSAGNTPGDSWSIVDEVHSSVAYGSAFAVEGFTQNGAFWETVANGVHYRFNTTNGVLSALHETLTITTTADSGPGSLRAALAGAANGDTIDLTGIAGTITLTSGQLNVPCSVTILGPGSGTLKVSGNHVSRVFNVTGANVAIRDLTIADGGGGVNGGGVYFGAIPGSVIAINNSVITNCTAPDGGGIYSETSGTMTVSNCIVSGNRATNTAGGGIFCYYGNLNVLGCTMSGNSALWGGAIESVFANQTVVGSTLTGNSAVGGGAIYSGNILTVVRSTLSGNSATNYGGGIYNDGLGGQASLVVSNSILTGNSAGAGGGLYSSGSFGGATLTIANSTVSSNSAVLSGGGIYNDGRDSGTGVVTVATSVIIANTAGNDGGGIMNDGSGGSALLTITGSIVGTNRAYLGAGIFCDGQVGSARLTNNASTFAGNSAFDGGGIYSFAGGTGGHVAVTLNVSTFSGNVATYQGGGVFNDGQSSGNAILAINACTFSGNRATNGGGSIYNYGILSGNARVEVGDSILSANAASTNVFNNRGTIISAGCNLSSDSGGGSLTNATDQINSDPKLALFGNYGGPTPSMPPLPGSPAIDGCTTGTSFTTDQRGAGFPRIVGAYADIGAVESGNPIPALMVNTTADENDGMGTNGVSLRDAVGFAPAGSTIVFAPGLSGTITLTNGQLDVSNSIMILGPGSGTLTISGSNASRVFSVTGTNAAISGLTIVNGSANYGAGILVSGGLGSVFNLNDCVVTSNSAAWNVSGGGVYNGVGVTMTISNCTISANNAPGGGSGGGVCNDSATLTIIASTLSGNRAGFGGGVVNNGSSGGHAKLIINASTFSDNSAVGGGGAILNYGSSGNATLAVNACTFAGNSSLSGQNGGGIFTSGDNGIGTVLIANTILNAGALGANLYSYGSTITSAGYNLSSDNGGGFLTATADQINIDPKLGPLQNNGGPVWTCAVLPGSPAIDKGKVNAIPALARGADQRGLPRPVDNPYAASPAGGDGSDIGAFEAQYTVVTSAADNGPGTLRNTLAGATDGDMIVFGVSGAITLTTGQLNVSDSVNIYGPGAGTLTVSGNNVSRVFNITGTNVIISGLTIANGNTSLNGAGINADGGVLSLSECVIANNLTSKGGGGIYNNRGKTITITNCTISGNRAPYGWGGGIYNYNGILTVVASTLSDNWAHYLGGGIDNDGMNFGGSAVLTINASTLSSNSADGYGGGIHNIGSGTGGSAILSINASTLTGNSASLGGGIANRGPAGTAIAQIGDTILNAGPSGENIYNGSGTIQSDGYNLASDNGSGCLTNATDRVNTDPLLGPMQDNGGPTWTCALLSSSPAIDRGKANAVAGLGLAADQRGFARAVDFAAIANVTGGDGSDIGAFEAQAFTGNPPRLTGVQNSGSGLFQFEFTDNTDGATFTVLTTTNLALPLSNWTVLGVPIEISPGQFQFSDAQATNNTQRFYRVSSP